MTNYSATMADAITAVLRWIGYPASSTPCAPSSREPIARPST